MKTKLFFALKLLLSIPKNVKKDRLAYTLTQLLSLYNLKCQSKQRMRRLAFLTSQDEQSSAKPLQKTPELI